MLVVCDTSPVTALLKRGRSVAEARGLRVIGLLGVLLIAKKAGLISSVAPIITELESRARFFTSEAVKKIILKAAGEGP
jgi:predicted nucleic acid-binding protein